MHARVKKTLIGCSFNVSILLSSVELYTSGDLHSLIVDYYLCEEHLKVYSSNTWIFPGCWWWLCGGRAVATTLAKLTWEIRFNG